MTRCVGCLHQNKTKCSRTLQQQLVRDGAKIGGQRRVHAFENRNHNVALPQSGNHTPGEDEVEEVDKYRLPQREIGF